MALRTDESEMPDWSPLHGYVDVRGRSTKEVANLIAQRLAPMEADAAGTAEVPDRVLLYQTADPREYQWAPAATRDEAFSELWSIAGAHFAADVLEGPITADRLQEATCLVLTIGPQKTTHFPQEDLDAIRGFVRGGNGLLMLGTYYGDRHHVANLSSLAETFGISFNADVLTGPSGRPSVAGRADIRIDLTPAGSRRRGSIALSKRETRDRALQEVLLARIRAVQSEGYLLAPSGRRCREPSLVDSAQSSFSRALRGSDTED
jgi:hypothetical protein